MRTLTTLLLVLALLPLAGAATPGTPIAAGPGGNALGYATPAAAVPVGGSLTFVNGDLFRHNVVSIEVGETDAPWCVLYAAGACPLFWSPLVGLGGETEVLGLENLEVGSTYSFYCTLHKNMVGTLVALPPV